MNFKQTKLNGVWLIEPVIFQDERGQFLEAFRKERFKEKGILYDFVQDNISTSGRGTVRGLHYQKEPHAQAKLVMAVNGIILDVAVDLRKNSPTFGQYFSAILSDENRNMMLVPEGFAHGFSVLSEQATVLYKCSSYYNKPAERGLFWNDPELNIGWQVEEPVISEKDSGLPTLNELPDDDLFN